MNFQTKKKRSRLEVNRDILLEVKNSGNSISPTNLMRKSNLSFQVFEECILDLNSKNFLIKNFPSKKSSRYVYGLSDKGVIFLNKFREFNDFLTEFGF
jgi:predicted transcriptional regulator